MMIYPGHPDLKYASFSVTLVREQMFPHRVRLRLDSNWKVRDEYMTYRIGFLNKKTAFFEYDVFNDDYFFNSERNAIRYLKSTIKGIKYKKYSDCLFRTKKDLVHLLSPRANEGLYYVISHIRFVQALDSMYD